MGLAVLVTDVHTVQEREQRVVGMCHLCMRESSSPQDWISHSHCMGGMGLDERNRHK